MSFVGTRPEATKYVEKYSNEMLATLLLPAGITSEASIRYKDEAELVEAYLDGNLEVFGQKWEEIPFAKKEKIGCTVSLPLMKRDSQQV